jgi:hypothetical protein
LTHLARRDHYHYHRQQTMIHQHFALPSDPLKGLLVEDELMVESAEQKP